MKAALRRSAAAALLAAAVALPAHAQAPAARRGPARDAFLPNFARSFYPGRSGQIMIVPREGHFITRDEPANAFMHGTPWGYDARVPLILHRPRAHPPRRVHGPRRPPGHRAHHRRDARPAGAADHDRPRALRWRCARERRPRASSCSSCWTRFRADYLDRHAAALPTLSRLRREGASFPAARVDYLPSATGVAHATISTGADPSIHGITVNTVFDAATGKASDPFADRSPRNLMAPALADLWSEATGRTGDRRLPGGALLRRGRPGRPRGLPDRRARGVRVRRTTARPGCGRPTPSVIACIPSLAERTPRALWEAAQGVWRGHDITGPDLVRRSALFAAYEVDSLLGRPWTRSRSGRTTSPTSS